MFYVGKYVGAYLISGLWNRLNVAYAGVVRCSSFTGSVDDHHHHIHNRT